jgi:hypothetical protein
MKAHALIAAIVLCISSGTAQAEEKTQVKIKEGKHFKEMMLNGVFTGRGQQSSSDVNMMISDPSKENKGTYNCLVIKNYWSPLSAEAAKIILHNTKEVTIHSLQKIDERKVFRNTYACDSRHDTYYKVSSDDILVKDKNGNNTPLDLLVSRIVPTVAGIDLQKLLAYQVRWNIRGVDDALYANDLGTDREDLEAKRSNLVKKSRRYEDRIKGLTTSLELEFKNSNSGAAQ